MSLNNAERLYICFLGAFKISVELEFELNMINLITSGPGIANVRIISFQSSGEGSNPLWQLV